MYIAYFVNFIFFCYSAMVNKVIYQMITEYTNNESIN